LLSTSAAAATVGCAAATTWTTDQQPIGIGTVELIAHELLQLQLLLPQALLTGMSCRHEKNISEQAW
jgi:hypothetical protein